MRKRNQHTAKTPTTISLSVRYRYALRMQFDPFRVQKAEKIRAMGGQPYAALFDRLHTLHEGKSFEDGTIVQTAGRVMLFRDMGKLTFATLQDHTDRLQICFKEDVIGAEEYARVLELLDRGDFIGIRGERFTTKRNEPTVLVKEWTMLTKSLNQPPEKWHGIADQETAWRQRYLDMMSNRETLERFKMRSLFIKLMREYYWSQGFIEVETPVLVNEASGTLATPFKTHHEAYDMDVYLRIAPETFLKECLVGGFDRVFECGRIFRNEGVDPSHLQDFTEVEHYAAYWDYEKNMEFTEQMLGSIIQELTGSTKISIPDRDGNLIEVDFAPPWPRISIKDAILQACGIDFMVCNSAPALLEAMKSKNIRLDVPVDKLGYGNLIDQLYKKVARPKIVQPTFLTQHPIELSPLARRNDHHAGITDRFQLVVGGWEIVNAYSELVDPVDQAQRFEDQSKARAGGDNDAHGKDDEYVHALSYGCPPCSGWGMGVDRLMALLTKQTNIRDVVLFPLMKPLAEETKEAKDSKEANELKTPKGKISVSDMRTEALKNSANIASLPLDQTKRFIAVLNGKVEPGKLMNALGHMTAGLVGLEEKPEDMHFLEYVDQEGNLHAHVSHYPFIILKADNSNQIRTLRNEAIKRNMRFNDFTQLMTIGRSAQQFDAMKQTAEADLEYFGICFFGNTEELKELTKKFSLFKGISGQTGNSDDSFGKEAKDSKETKETKEFDATKVPATVTQQDAASASSASFDSSKANPLSSLASASEHLLQHAEYGHLLPQAHLLLEEHTVQTKAHLIATGAAMEALAKKFGGDPLTWKVAGTLHDLDWDNLAKDYEAHCGSTLEQMLQSIKAPQELLGDIRAHYQEKYGAEYPLDSMLRKCLYCVDELTGFIIAVTYVRPSRKIADVEVSSVKKKMKDKGFAAQVDRSQIQKCEELLGIGLDEFIGITLDAMKSVADQLGL